MSAMECGMGRQLLAGPGHRSDSTERPLNELKEPAKCERPRWIAEPPFSAAPLSQTLNVRKGSSFNERLTGGIGRRWPGIDNAARLKARLT